MNSKKILLLFICSEGENSPVLQGNVEERCQSLSAQLNIELAVSLVSASEVSRQIQQLAKDADALIVHNEGYAANAMPSTVEELERFEALAQSGIPIVEVHERNIFANDDVRPYLDLPGISAGVVSGMGADGFALAIRALAARLESKAA